MSIFAASAVLLAINHPDPQERLARVEALARLVEDFAVELVFDGDRFIGLVDAMPPLRVEIAMA
jgi:hypothetical protein